jgi:putative transport protein
MGLAPFALAVAIGIMVGSIKIPMGNSSFSLGTTGGTLLTALVIAHFGRIGKLSMQANKKTLEVFRELGLIFFLMAAGIPAGAKFVQYFKPEYALRPISTTYLNTLSNGTAPEMQNPGY